MIQNIISLVVLNVLTLSKAVLVQNNLEGISKASIIKYLWRYEKKNGLEDLEKADWFLRKLRYEVENE